MSSMTLLDARILVVDNDKALSPRVVLRENVAISMRSRCFALRTKSSTFGHLLRRERSTIRGW